MNLYKACIRLGIWPTVRSYAEMWSVDSNKNDISILEEVKDLAKRSFRKLSMEHHPDKGGDHNNFLEIQESFNKVKNSTIKCFISALDEELESNINYYEPGSDECKECSRWSSMVGMCITITCSGFQPSAKPKLVNARKNKFEAAFDSLRSEN